MTNAIVGLIVGFPADQTLAKLKNIHLSAFDRDGPKSDSYWTLGSFALLCDKIVNLIVKTNLPFRELL